MAKSGRRKNALSIACGVMMLWMTATHAAPKPLMRDFMGINGNIGIFRPKLYAEHLRHFGRGVRDHDPNLKIVTCNVQTGDVDIYSIPTSCLVGNEAYYDVIATHGYAFADRWPTYRRSFPEDPSYLWGRTSD